MRLAAESDIGLCVPRCEPLANDCVEGTHCLPAAGVTDADGNGQCIPDGRGELGDGCQDIAGCADGLACVPRLNGAVCETLCDDEHPCAEGAECAPLSDFPEYGTCVEVDWSCVGAVDWPAAGQATATVTVQTVDPVNASLFAAVVSVNLCAEDDPDCATPLDTQQTSALGMATFTVPVGEDGFSGYFEGTAEGRLVGLSYDSRPITEDGRTVLLGMADPDVLDTLGLRDPARGSIGAQVTDCAGSLSAGVSLAVDIADAMTLIGYSTSKTPFDQTATATSSAGRGAAALVPAGQTTLTFISETAGQLATRTVHVRADAFTTLRVEPTP